MLTTACLALLVAADTSVTLRPRPPDEVPAAVAALLAGVEADRYTVAWCREWYAADGVRPFLVAAMLGERPPKAKPLARAHAEYFAARFDDLLAKWGKAGRFDLIAEAAVVVARGDPAYADRASTELREAVAALLDDTFPAAVNTHAVKAKGVDAEAAVKRVAGMREELFRRFSKDFDRPTFSDQFTGHTLRFESKGKPQLSFSRAACLADRIEIDTGSDHAANFYCTRSDFAVTANWKFGQRFCNTFLVSNGRAALSGGGLSDQGDLQCAVVVADGDVDLPDNRYHYGSFVIARGDIRSPRGLHGDRCVYVAGGRIAATAAGTIKKSLLLAGTEIDIGDEKKPADAVRLVGVTPTALGVRWFELADVGVEVEAADGKVVVKGVAERSPFAGQLRKGDTLSRVNTRTVETADGCRRAVREAVVLGFALLSVQRGGELHHLHVALDKVALAP